MSTPAKRQASYRRRRAAGRAVRFVATDSVALAVALVTEGILTEAETEDPAWIAVWRKLSLLGCSVMHNDIEIFDMR